MWEKIKKWWWFTIANPIVRKGESGAFKWVFRRFWLEISTVSGNFKVRFTAAEHPYGYLMAGKDDRNIIGFCQMVYTVGMLLTTDQGFANDVAKAVGSYEERIEKENPVKEDETEDKIAIEFEKQVQERVEMPRRYRRKADRETDRKFRENLKKAEGQVSGERPENA